MSFELEWFLTFCHVYHSVFAYPSIYSIYGQARHAYSNQNIATRSNYCVSCQLALGTDSAKFSARVELSLLLAIQPCLMSHNYVSIFAYVFGALSGGPFVC